MNALPLAHKKPPRKAIRRRFAALGSIPADAGDAMRRVGESVDAAALQDDVDFRRRWRQVVGRTWRANADAAAGDCRRHPLEEFGEGAGVHSVERCDGVGELLQIGGVRLRPGGAGDVLPKPRLLMTGMASL